MENQEILDRFDRFVQRQRDLAALGMDNALSAKELDAIDFAARGALEDILEGLA